ncbi:hypothetical protein NDU88_008163 [Pleurodeles waltl]|uniref:Uncharacterized protein n=1 Tax=Pleurodeles waltl TaxID=8319 RepID=A0AAV7NYE9_PLEWA|nr:hypothetical protein NDU88_008163 [Pleurodeles waltl]
MGPIWPMWRRIPSRTGVLIYGISSVSGSAPLRRSRCTASSKLRFPPPGWAKDVTRVRLSQLSWLTSISQLPTPVFPSPSLKTQEL